MLTIVAVAGAHLWAATRIGAAVATVGETRLTLAATRGVGSVDPISLSERLAAPQIALVQALLPTAGVPLVDAARWACLLLGALTALLVGPALRGSGTNAAATVAGVLAIGASVPALVLHSGISAAAPAAAWLTGAAALAAYGHGRAAGTAAVVAALTAPLAAAALLALAAHFVLSGLVHRVRFRVPVGLGVGVVAVAVAALATGTGPLAGVAGPELSTPVAAAVAAVGVLLAAQAWRVAEWLRPALTAQVLLCLATLAPGPSRAAAMLLLAPMLALAFAVVVEQVSQRHERFASGGSLALLLVGVVGPGLGAVAVLPLASTREPAALGWLAASTDPDTVVRADPLDRAELTAVGFPASRLRGTGDPPVPGELLLDTDRPTDGLPPSGITCPPGAAVTAVALGTGGASTVVCRTDGDGSAVAAEAAARARFGAALSENGALQIAPDAAGMLRDGMVDPRLMLVLTALTTAQATAYRIDVSGFPAAALDAPATPRRQMLLSLRDGGSPDLVRTWLSGQRPPFVPMTTVPAGDDLLISYPAPPPSGLLPP